VIDLHSHILPGIDDGAKSIEESVEIAKAAVADGVEVIAATPHVRDDYPTTAETMETLVGQVRRALLRERVPLDVRKGGELALTWLDRLSDVELRRFGLGGNPGYLLVEFPYYGWPLRLPDWVFQLQTRGMTLVIAHPERNADVQAAPEKLRPLVEAGALVQVTAGSVDGRLGSAAKETGLDLVERGLVHVLASDAHHPSVRAGGLDAAVDAIGDEELARWLSLDVPEAIVTGRAVPSRPERRRRRFGIL
jgi:protein-tyrosine phosphatase